MFGLWIGEGTGSLWWNIVGNKMILIFRYWILGLPIGEEYRECDTSLSDLSVL